MKKLLLIFPIVALLAAGCGTTQQAANQPADQTPVVQNNNTEPSPSPAATSTTATTATSTNEQLSNWVTLTSDILHFSVKYPSNWTTGTWGPRN